MILLFTVAATPCLADYDEAAALEAAIKNINFTVPTANDGMLVTAMRMAGKLQPNDELANAYILAVNDALARGSYVNTTEAVLGVTAAGMDASALQNGALLTALETESASITNPVLLADTLLALACGGYSLPSGTTTQVLVDRLRSVQNPDSGFGEGGVSNMTATAKALAALAYYKEFEGVQDSINNGGGYMVVSQAEVGNFPAEKGDTVTVTALAIIGLSVNGFDAARLTQEGGDAVEYLCKAQSPDGGFGTFVGAGTDRATTTTAAIALAAHRELAVSAFNFSKNLSTQLPEKTESAQPTPPPTENVDNSEPSVPEEDAPLLPFGIEQIILVFVIIAILGAAVPIIIIKLTHRRRR
ncbi:MAG: prenyltransferase/squalene oxidase repeat-containing protein [Oscillospiraceae bacterium]